MKDFISDDVINKRYYKGSQYQNSFDLIEFILGILFFLIVLIGFITT